jgi:ABC-type Fe3+-hydroxamate transport system substrate-binding protein
VNRRALIGSLGALLFSAGAAIGVSRLAARSPAKKQGVRVVSLTPAITETLLSIGAAEQLVGVSNYCVLPKGSALPRVGTALTPSYEAIAGLRPTLVLSDGSAGSKHAELSAIARTEVLAWLSLSDVVESIRRLGELTGRRSAAEELATRMHTRLSGQPAPGAPRVLMLFGFDPDRPAELWFIKRNSLHGAALAAAGAKNAVDRDVPGLPRLGVEELVKLDPDQVYFLPSPGATPEQNQRLLTGFAALAPLRAVKQHKLAIVNGTASVGPSVLELCESLRITLQQMAAP